MEYLRVWLLILFTAASVLLSLSIAALSRAPRRKLKDPGKTETPEPCVFGLRVWNLAVRLGAAFAAAGLIPQASLPAPILLALFTAAFIALTELLPAAAAARKGEAVLDALFPVLAALGAPWKPLYALIHPRPADAGEEAFRRALEEGEQSGAVESRERSMVEGVLYLGDRPVGAFMTHRSEIQCLDIGSTPEEAGAQALRCRDQGFFPVVRETQDDIAGVVSAEDIFQALAVPKGWKGLAAIMRRPCFIPETISALKAFEAFRREGKDFLCVMDEYGGFAGSLRLRDLMEEIVGGLTGSCPEEELLRQEDGSWLAGGGVSVDELAEVLGVESLGGGSYHTLAGFILKLAGDIPHTGDSFLWGSYRFTVIDRDGNRIDKVLISRQTP